MFPVVKLRGPAAFIGLSTALPRLPFVAAGRLGQAQLDELERTHILRVLELCEGQKTKAASMLGINRTTLWKKLRQYGIEGD